MELNNYTIPYPYLNIPTKEQVAIQVTPESKLFNTTINSVLSAAY